MQLTIGDKGSYLYAAFGAPVAHEDDAERAMSAVLELRRPPESLNFIDSPQIGISQGQMLTGAYGGTTRCTYGVLGDEVNMAARLMQAAEPGQVLVSQAAQQFAEDEFVWSELPPLKVKGKTDLVTAFSLEGQQKHQAIHLKEPEYTLPLLKRFTFYFAKNYAFGHTLWSLVHNAGSVAKATELANEFFSTEAPSPNIS